MNKLKEFLTWNRACIEGIEGLDRLAATGAKTLEEAWERADARDLVWAVAMAMAVAVAVAVDLAVVAMAMAMVTAVAVALAMALAMALATAMAITLE